MSTRDSQDSYDECSDEAVELLAIIENADYDEGGTAVFELRKLLPNLDQYIKDEVADEVARSRGTDNLIEKITPGNIHKAVEP